MKKKTFLRIVPVLMLALMLAVFAGCGPVDPDDGGKKPPKITDGDVCIDLNITRMPTKTEYKHGEKFNPAGLIFDAVYENGFDGDKNLNAGDLDGWSPSGALSADITAITLRFESCEKAIPITVIAKELLSMEITREPDIKAYSVGDALDLSGLTVKAEYEEGTIDNESGYTVTDEDGKTYSQGTILDTAVKNLELTVSLKVGEITKTDAFTVHVDTLIKVQVEDVVASGEEAPDDKSYTVITGKPLKDLIKTDCTFTGSGYLGNVSKDVKVDFYIYSEEAVINADLVLIASSTRVGSGTMLDCQFNKLYRVFIGEGAEEEEVFIGDDVIIEGKPFPPSGSTGNQWTNWADVSFGSIELKAGFNKVSVQCIGSEKDADGKNDRTPNIDRLDVRLSDTPDAPAKGDTCTDIEIKTMPAKLDYKVGEVFSAAGIVFNAIYANGYTGDYGLTAARLTWEPTGALTTSDTSVTVTFKNISKTIDITVTEKVLQSVEITGEPNKVDYVKGSALNLGGLVVKATYAEGVDADAKNYVITDISEKVYTTGTILSDAGTLTLTVSITVGDVTKSDTFTVTVYDGLTVQAEDVLESGGEPPANQSYTVFSGQGNINTANGSGSGCIENVGIGSEKGATKIEFYVYSVEAISAADIVFTMASTNNTVTSRMADMQFNKLFKVSIGDGAEEEELVVGDGVFVEGKEVPSGMNRWYLWDDVTVGMVDLEQGFTKITIECISQMICEDGGIRAASVDCLTIRPNDTADIRGKEIQSVEITKMPTFVNYGADAKFTAEGLTVKAVYEGGLMVIDAKNYIIKDADGTRFGQDDPLGATQRDVELFVEISNGGEAASASFTIHINSGEAITVQCEAIASGTPPTNESYTVITGKYKEEKNANGATSISDPQYDGANKTTIEFHIYSEKAVKGAELVLRAASLNRGPNGSNMTYDSQFNKIFKLSVGGIAVTVGNGVVIAGRTSTTGESTWFMWTENTIAKLDLNAGYTVVTLECIGKITDSNGGDARSANLDKIDIKF